MEISFICTKSFYMVVVEGGNNPQNVKYEEYEVALKECNRLSQKENKTAYVVRAITKIKQVSQVTKLEI